MVLIIRIASAELERLFDFMISSFVLDFGKSPKNGIDTLPSISCLCLILVSKNLIKNKIKPGINNPSKKATVKNTFRFRETAPLEYAKSITFAFGDVTAKEISVSSRF